MAVKLNQHDLEFILKQIKIAEAHTAGIPLDQLIVQPHLPYGLRTVDGSYNNLIPGRELWGASGQPMPRLLEPHFRSDGDTDSFDYNGPTQPGGNVTNTDYGQSGDVADADPRLISNLIADQTLSNPAAITAALQHAGLSGAELTAALQGVMQAHIVVKALAAMQNQPAYQIAKANLDELLEEHGIEMEGANIVLPNVAPDEGLSAPFNGWMTFFGQFFDHGLDLIGKGGNGTIYVPLAADDPLRTHGPDGIPGSGDEVPPHMAFMALTRSTQVNGPGADGILGTADDTMGEAVNKTTPFVDQNQTYTSHPSHQVFLREYEMVDGKPLATGRLLDGASGGLPTWADVKQQAAEKLGIILTDDYVQTVPLLRTDLYGEFIRNADGFPLVVVGIGPDGIPNTADDIVASGTADNPLDPSSLNGGLGPVRTMHAFLDDIAHNAAPVMINGQLVQDADTLGDPGAVGNAIAMNPFTGANLEYDNELLDRHFVTGDGRGNENIGLTAVHHVFHSEHNRQIAANQLEILKTGNLEFINEWLLVDLADLSGVPANDSAALAAFAAGLEWDGERLFQTARFATEMQYQHLVFEEFGRKVQPLIDLFVFNTITDINPAIFAEFAHTVYRFGHSMLTDSIALMPLDENGNPIYYDENGQAHLVENIDDWGMDVGLIDAFLNPVSFDQDGTISADQAAGAIVRGMMRVHGNEIDEFVVEALRNNLLGLPLDLPAINIARGRDAGVPTLNEARAQLYTASSSSFLKPYDSWVDFAANLKTPASVINFIAAYGTHSSITEADTLEEKRAAATLLVMGGAGSPEDRLAFLNGTTYLGGTDWSTVETGLNLVDFWIGGLAEKKMPFGGFLGSTFNAVFELQMENLQDGDRFYYLTRTQGLNLLNELENNAFTKLIMANTDLTDPGPDGVRGTDDDIINNAVGVDSFAKHDFVFEMDMLKQIGDDPAAENPVLEALLGGKVVRDNPATVEDESDPNSPNGNTYFRFTGGEHIVVNGTEGDDIIISDFGDDALWGGGGNDRIEGGAGVDLIIGGAGNDIITDSGDTGDFLKGEAGDDVIANSNGLDILMGGDGQDVFLVGVDATEVFAGEGNDFILGGDDADFLMGNEGDDWIEGGDGFDVLSGDNSELFFNSTIKGHDVLFAGPNENDFDAESGDDIMVQGESVMRNEGMLGFDWAIHKGSSIAADSDMRIPIFTTVADDILRDRFDQTEGLSGWKHNDILRGDDRGSREEIEVELDMTGHELDQAGVDRIDGLRELLGLAERNGAGDDEIAWTGGNVLLGGDGHDVMEGRGGDDFIHGDAWLNVRISIRSVEDPLNPATEFATVDSLKDEITVNGVTKPLSELLLAGIIQPKQLQIVREIQYAEDTTDDVDTAVFAGNKDWYEITHLDGDIVKVARREQEEIDPQIDEGTDTLVGIERIQFADQIYTIRETGNVDPTGRLILGPLPAQEDKPLTVSAAQIRDANNPGGIVTNITYRWQIERNDGTGDYINIPGASGPTFTPGDEHTGLRIRVLGTYTDAGGVTETVSSAPTDVVLGLNDQPTGPLLISDMTPTQDQELTATVAFTDADGMSDAFEEGLLTYQWQYSPSGLPGTWVNVSAEDGGNLRNVTPRAEHVGQHLRVVVAYTDDLGNAHTVESAVTEIVGNHIVSNAATIDAGNGDSEGGVTTGADWVQGGSGANVISGLAGDDRLEGGEGSDTLQGGDGADTLVGGGGDDVVLGEAGNDTIIYAAGDDNDMIDGGEGADTLRIVNAANGPNDNITVELAAGVITRVGGADIASIENVQMDLGAGVDTLNYNGTSESVSVNLLTGTATGFAYVRGVENVTGGSNNDTLLGNNADNRLIGAEGADTLRGGHGNDTLEGGAANDLLHGEEGDDTLLGGLGDDRLDGGAGSDTASYAGAAAGVTVSLDNAAVQNTVAAGNDLLVAIENLTGSSHGDNLTGNAGQNVIDGGAGADTMTGGDGDDTYVVDNASDSVTEAATAGSGTDTVRSSVAAYTLAANVENLVLTGAAVSGTGNNLDNKLTGNANSNILDGGVGDDTVVLAGSIADHEFALSGANLTVTSAGNGTDTLTSIENVELDGVTYNIVQGTNAANNPLNGTGEADLVLGLNGADTLVAGGGDDILVGGNQSDVMQGGSGNDTYLVQQGGDLADETGGSGIDTILSSVTRNLNNAAHALGDVENVTLIGAGNINATGNALGNVLTGNAGNNTLSGQGGQDTLIGNAGNDALLGGAGNDTLAGGDGNDTLNGQGGAADVAVFAGSAGNYSFGFTGNSLTSVTDLVGNGGTDTIANIERLQFGDGTSLAIVTDASGGDGALSSGGAAVLFGGAGNDTIVGSVENDVIIGGAGDDTLSGSDVGDEDAPIPGVPDDDTFIWYAGDGFDTINGGMEGANGDTFHIVGNAEAETYRIYTYTEAVARIGYTGSDENEIVVTRAVMVDGVEVETAIAELTEIEEIVVNGSNVGGNGSSGGDTFEIYGNFDTTTSLRPNTITVIGSAGDDTIDISSLLSAHRIVFKSKGGNDTIIGTLRPQDVVELADGKTIADYTSVTNEDGSTTLSGDGHSITFYSTGGMPQFSGGDNDDDDDDTDADHDDSNDQDDDTDQPNGSDNDDDDENENDDEDDDDVPLPAAGGLQLGTAQADAISGTSGDDTLSGLAGDDAIVGGSGADVITGGAGNDLLNAGGGRDLVFGGEGNDDILGGADDDMLYGDEGADRLLGGSGDDFLNGGASNDTIFGGAGDDLIVAQASDGNDTYYGDEMSGGSGNDTLDMSVITANVTVDLGSGFMGRGSALSSQSGNDTLWGLENIITGSGDDIITASGSVNIIDGADGDDVFRFLSAGDADEDVIVSFQPGDKIDLSAIDAIRDVDGNQSFTLVAGSSAAEAGQLAVSYETQNGEDYTIVQGNTTGGDEANFRINIKGTHNLSNSDFNL